MTSPAAATRPTDRAQRGPAQLAFPVALTVGMVLIAINLRPAVASVGPVLKDLRADTGLSTVGASLLTAIPILCFGALAPVAPRLARKVGLRPALGILLGVLLVGLLLRLVPGIPLLFVGTMIAAAGIASANVLVPALIKDDYAGRTGLAMGIYTTMLTLAAAAAVGISVPAENALGGGWRTALGLWAIPAAVALVAWLPLARTGDEKVPEAPRVPGSLHREPIAWHVTVYFGLQALGFYAVLAWLPSLYQDAGYSAAAAGGLVSLTAFIQCPVALVVPMLATRARDQRMLVLVAGLCAAGGLLGILAAPTAAPLLWILLLGLGQGAAFPLGLTLVVLRTAEPAVTARLSAMAQTGGYLLAALGPFLVGALHDLTDSWTSSLVLLLVLLVPQVGSGLIAGRARLAVPRLAQNSAT
ncbi:MAG TPA: MFS transporter [Frankiaceae bacterium]|nr:MFS transporter [Frankiaceae bacterium]